MQTLLAYCTLVHMARTSPHSTTSVLTPIQGKVLDVFLQCAADGKPPPTYAELSQTFGWRSRNAAKGHVLALKRKGALLAALEGLARGITIPSPVVHRTPLIERVGQRRVGLIPIPPYLVPESGILFAFNQPDDRLAREGVLAGDLVLVGHQDVPVEPRLTVVTENGRPVAVSPSRTRRRGTRGVVVAITRSHAARAMRAMNDILEADSRK
jgi:SOS-response transcriptional repressor LexA